MGWPQNPPTFGSWGPTPPPGTKISPMVLHNLRSLSFPGTLWKPVPEKPDRSEDCKTVVRIDHILALVSPEPSGSLKNAEKLLVDEARTRPKH